MTARSRYRNSVTVTLGGLVVLAWALLWWLEQTPWGAVFHAHHGGPGAHAGHGMSGGLMAVFFVAGWVLMVIAMMLPATFPLVEVFRRLVRRRPDSGALLALLVTGYLAVWTVFGVGVYGAGQALRLVELPVAGGVAAGALFLVAGAFQFSQLKYRCLDQCRTPLAFVLARWPGNGSRKAAAFRIGAEHGAFCVGCCWALMLLMFAVATASLLWMMVLGILMAVEKNLSWGRSLGRPLGGVLLVVGLWLLAVAG
ncbi:MAG: DUF2182 domain-containing protein [Gammaproteobacteria bacterium]